MDIDNLKGLMEAYQQVYASQEVDEAVYGGEPKKPADTRMTVTAADKKANTKAWQKYKAGHPSYKAADHLGEESFDEATAMAKRGHDETAIRNKIAKSTGGGEAADRASALEKKSTFGDAKKAKARQDLARKQRGDFRKTTSSSPGLHGYAHKSNDPAVKAKQAARGAQRGALTPAEKKQLNREEFDIFDTVLEFLYVEGYAETLEDAEWMMANELDADDIEEILEAEGSYGKTPKASAAYSALVRKRTNKPASEYSKKGEKTKKVKSAEKHMWRSLRGGPHHGRGKMTADDRTERRSERAFDLETSYGSGSVTKNPKKLRKQKAMGEHD
jgi:hypothetical protein